MSRSAMRPALGGVGGVRIGAYPSRMWCRCVRGPMRQAAARSPGEGFGSGTKKAPKVKSLKGKDLEKLGEEVALTLKSINVVVVGDDTQTNQHLADILAQLLHYTPLSTAKVLEGLGGCSLQEIIDSDGPEAFGLSEAVALECLSAHVRCVVGTCGAGIGAAARGACWRHLYGAVSIWLDTRSEEDPSPLPQDDAYSLSEIYVKLRTADGSKADGKDAARGAALEVLPAIKSLLKKDKDLPGKKSLYARWGSRGDWPVLKPPEWDPEQEVNLLQLAPCSARML